MGPPQRRFEEGGKETAKGKGEKDGLEKWGSGVSGDLYGVESDDDVVTLFNLQ